MNNEEYRRHEESEKKDTITLSQKEAGQIVAVLIIGAFFIFVTGYFFGKKKMLEEMADKQDVSFAHKVHSSFGAFVDDVELPAQSVEDEPMGCDPELAVDPDEEEPFAEKTPLLKVKSTEPIALAYAQLCGFGTKRAAESYLDKLTRRAIDAQIVDRKSKTKKGTVITWYQVTTNTMEKKKLVPLVEKIKKTDKLTGVKIIDIRTHEA